MYSDEQIRQIILDTQAESEYVADKSLKELHSTNEPRFVEIALVMLDEEDYEPVRAAIITLRNLLNFNPPQFLPRVTQFLEVPSHCATAIWFIWSVGNASYVPGLMRFLFDPEKEVRYEAIKTIARYGHADLYEIALLMLNDTYSYVRSTACGIISRYPNDIRSFDILISKLHDSGEAAGETVGARIAIRLGEIGDLRAVQPLIDAVRYGHDRLAWRALLALRDMQIPSLESLCWEQIRHKYDRMKSAALNILGNNPKAEYTDTLISIVQNDPDLGLQSWAAGSLKRIGTMKVLAVADKWLEEQKRKS